MQPSRFIPRATRESADRASTPLLWSTKATLSQTSFSQIRETKNRAYGKDPNEVRWKNLLRHLEFRCLPEVRNSFPGAGEGIRTPDPRFTKPMLYRLSYASIRVQVPYGHK
jgi:hypothetical protein